MPRVGRPSIGDRVSVRLPDDLLAVLDRRARDAGLSRAEAIRILLDRALSPSSDDGVDRTQITHRLAMTPAQRVHRMAEETRRLQTLTGRTP
ncbi:MAG: CopG family transcriptional regulator [Microthrixaceae bacterium]